MEPRPQTYEIFPAIPGLPVTDVNRFATRRIHSSRTDAEILFNYAVLVSEKPCLLLSLRVETLWLLSGGTRFVLLCDSDRLDGRNYVARYKLNLSSTTATYANDTADICAQGWLFEKGLVLIASDDPWSTTIPTSGTKFIHVAEILS